VVNGEHKTITRSTRFSAYKLHVLKKSQGTLSSRLFLSSNHRAVLPWCTQTLELLSYPWIILTVKASMVHFAMHHFVRNLLWQKCWCSRKRSHFFQFIRVFQRSVTHSRVERGAHQAAIIKAMSLLCACAQFQHSSLHCYGSSIDLQWFCESKWCSLTFFFFYKEV
jgi:hypothetical protein